MGRPAGGKVKIPGGLGYNVPGLGRGLGLAKRLVEEHGGTISADSQPGQTIITVTLPLAGPPKE